jgi:ElaB/YqjD/DUF883 family membrane-anchored ribosome-binding protein
MDDLKNDLSALKEDIHALNTRLMHEGAVRGTEMKDAMRTRMELMKAKGRTQIKDIETQVQDKPGQSLALAFGLGLAASLLMGRRR